MLWLNMVMKYMCLRNREKLILKNYQYYVHYINAESNTEKATKAKEAGKDVDKEISNIKDALNKIKDKDQYGETLKLLDGLRYLIKDATYQYEDEYRLLYFAEKDDVSRNILNGRENLLMPTRRLVFIGS